jgi:hypothetical protein
MASDCTSHGLYGYNSRPSGSAYILYRRIATIAPGSQTPNRPSSEAQSP